MVETSAVGQTAPSFGRKTGSVPLVRVKRACKLAGVMLNASDAAWQEAQVRPLVPRLWKKGPVTLIAAPDCALLSNIPDGLMKRTGDIGDAAAIAARESAPNVISFV